MSKTNRSPVGPRRAAGDRALRSFALLFVTLAGCAPDEPSAPGHQPIVAELEALLAERPDLRDALAEGIETAGIAAIHDVESFFGYVDDLVTWIPVERETIPRVVRLHYVVNQAPGDVLNRDPSFSAWLAGVARAWGAFLDSPASAAGIESFASMPDYRVEDFVEGPGGWRSFNQFFARQIKPGKRPVADPGDDAVIVSPADAILMGAWPVTAQSTIVVKDVEWAVADLLEGSPHADAFAGGLYAHAFLSVEDYHRYHTPVAGVVREVRHIPGRVYLDVAPREDGTLRGVNGDTYQFDQMRGLVVIESPEVGLVAMVPVGMSLISSVVLTPDVGAELRKGEEIGWFQFGGSDIVLIFQDRDVILEADVGEKLRQGERLARVGPGE